MRKAVQFTTSWDDGHLLDMRLAELLHKHGIKGTFYVPARVAPGGCCNPDGFEVLQGAQLRQLGSEFEIGSHTLDHRSLDSQPADEVRHQIVAGKRWLEDQLGRRVDGFCYPNGHHDETARRLVRESGFRYGRTTEDLHDGLDPDPFRMPVTLQFYPRRRIDVAKNFVREERRRLGQWRWPGRLPVFASAFAEEDFAARFRRLLDRACQRGGIFHVWGHSWEIDRIGAWSMLDELLRYAAERVPAAARVSNEALLAPASAGAAAQPVLES